MRDIFQPLAMALWTFHMHAHWQAEAAKRQTEDACATHRDAVDEAAGML